MAKSSSTTPPPGLLSANQLVSYNLMRARKAAGLTQHDMAERLEEITGRPWSNASVSAAEASWRGGRQRKFDANEIAAFSYALDRPIGYFLLAPDDAPDNLRISLSYPDESSSPAEDLTYEYFLDMVLGFGGLKDAFQERAAIQVKKFSDCGYVPPTTTFELQLDHLDVASEERRQALAEAAPDVATQAYMHALLGIVAKSGAAEVLKEAQRIFERRMSRINAEENGDADGRSRPKR